MGRSSHSPSLPGHMTTWVPVRPKNVTLCHSRVSMPPCHLLASLSTGSTLWWALGILRWAGHQGLLLHSTGTDEVLGMLEASHLVTER